MKIPWRRDRIPTPVFLGFPCSSAGKESACNVGDMGSIPGLGRSPGEGKGYPLQYSGLENSKGSMGWQRQRLSLSLLFPMLLPSCFSRVQLCATPEIAAHQAPMSPGKNTGVSCHFLLQFPMLCNNFQGLYISCFSIYSAWNNNKKIYLRLIFFQQIVYVD